jgi:hypothetical protein
MLTHLSQYISRFMIFGLLEIYVNINTIMVIYDCSNFVLGTSGAILSQMIFKAAR